MLQRVYIRVCKQTRASIVLCCVVLYCIVLYCTVLYCTALHCTVLYCTALHCTVLYCIVLYCIVFIHFHSASHGMSLSDALPTTAIDIVRSLHTEALQATVGEGLVQGLYVAVRAGFEPTTLRSKASMCVSVGRGVCRCRCIFL